MLMKCALITAMTVGHEPADLDVGVAILAAAVSKVHAAKNEQSKYSLDQFNVLLRAGNNGIKAIAAGVGIHNLGGTQLSEFGSTLPFVRYDIFINNIAPSLAIKFDTVGEGGGNEVTIGRRRLTSLLRPYPLAANAVDRGPGLILEISTYLTQSETIANSDSEAIALALSESVRLYGASAGCTEDLVITILRNVEKKAKKTDVVKKVHDDFIIDPRVNPCLAFPGPVFSVCL